MYKDINKAFLLPKPDGVHMIYVISLKSPLRQGQTLHQFIVLEFKKDQTDKVTVNLSPEEIKEKYGDRLQPEMEDTTYDILSTLFKELIKKSIIVPGEFRSSKNDEAIKCSIKAQDGYLYPLKNSIMFVYKPVIYIKLSEIKYVEFSRVNQISNSTNRSFDFTITKLKDSSTINFASVDKMEFKKLSTYFKQNQIKIINSDEDSK